MVGMRRLELLTSTVSRVSVSFTIQLRHQTVGERGAQEVSPEPVWRRYWRSTRRTTLSAMQTKSQCCWETASIDFAEGRLDPRVANAMGYLASVLLKALENGKIEDRLAHLEAILGRAKGTETEGFDFKPVNVGTNL